MRRSERRSVSVCRDKPTSSTTSMHQNQDQEPQVVTVLPAKPTKSATARLFPVVCRVTMHSDVVDKNGHARFEVNGNSHCTWKDILNPCVASSVKDDADLFQRLLKDYVLSVIRVDTLSVTVDQKEEQEENKKEEKEKKEAANVIKTDKQDSERWLIPYAKWNWSIYRWITSNIPLHGYAAVICVSFIPRTEAHDDFLAVRKQQQQKKSATAKRKLLLDKSGSQGSDSHDDDQRVVKRARQESAVAADDVSRDIYQAVLKENAEIIERSAADKLHIQNLALQLQSKQVEIDQVKSELAAQTLSTSLCKTACDQAMDKLHQTQRQYEDVIDKQKADFGTDQKRQLDFYQAQTRQVELLLAELNRCRERQTAMEKELVDLDTARQQAVEAFEDRRRVVSALDHVLHFVPVDQIPTDLAKFVDVKQKPKPQPQPKEQKEQKQKVPATATAVKKVPSVKPSVVALPKKPVKVETTNKKVIKSISATAHPKKPTVAEDDEDAHMEEEEDQNSKEDDEALLPLGIPSAGMDAEDISLLHRALVVAHKATSVRRRSKAKPKANFGFTPFQSVDIQRFWLARKRAACLFWPSKEDKAQRAYLPVMVRRSEEDSTKLVGVYCRADSNGKLHVPLSTSDTYAKDSFEVSRKRLMGYIKKRPDTVEEMAGLEAYLRDYEQQQQLLTKPPVVTDTKIKPVTPEKEKKTVVAIVKKENAVITKSALSVNKSASSKPALSVLKSPPSFLKTPTPLPKPALPKQKPTSIKRL